MHLVHINQIPTATTCGCCKAGLQNHLCVALHVFIHCPRNRKNFQTFRLQDAAIGVGIIGILITEMRMDFENHENRRVTVARSQDRVEKIW